MLEGQVKNSSPFVMYTRAFAEAWRDQVTVQQPVGQLFKGHNFELQTVNALKSASFGAHYTASHFLECIGKALSGLARSKVGGWW